MNPCIGRLRGRLRRGLFDGEEMDGAEAMGSVKPIFFPEGWCFIEGEDIAWEDTFVIEDNLTNSIHEDQPMTT